LISDGDVSDFQPGDGFPSEGDPAAAGGGFLRWKARSAANLLTTMTSVTEPLDGTGKYLFRFRNNQI
jgi:hypothetical protein